MLELATAKGAVVPSPCAHGARQPINQKASLDLKQLRGWQNLQHDWIGLDWIALRCVWTMRSSSLKRRNLSWLLSDLKKIVSALRVSTRRHRSGHLRPDHTSGNNIDQSKTHAPLILRPHTRIGPSTVLYIPPKPGIMTQNQHRTNLVRTERIIRKDVKAPGERIASPSRGCDLLRGDRENDDGASVQGPLESYA